MPLSYLLKLTLIDWSPKYRFGVYIEKEADNLNWLCDIKNKNNIVYEDHSIHNSYLYRVHLFTIESNLFDQKKSNLESKEYDCDTSIMIETINNEPLRLDILIFWGYCVWLIDESSLNINNISTLMDLDTYTMNEIVIYNSASFCYTDMIDKTTKNNMIIKYNDLIDIFKTNTFYLQKIALFYMGFKNSATSFVSKQKNVEHFNDQEDFYKKSEEKFIHIYNAVESGEKSYANRMMQYILTALTLLTIVSVFKDTIEFVKAEFNSENSVTKLDFISRSEFLILLLVAIIFVFFKVKKIINKL